MTALDGVIDEMDARAFGFIEKKFEPVQTIVRNINKLMCKVINAIQVYKETGQEIEIDYENWNEPAVGDDLSETDSVKENVAPDDAPRRPRRNAFKEATENIERQTLLSSTRKLRRPSATASDQFQNIYIKTEKRSDEVKIKTENEEMPAPSRPAPKKKKKTNTRIKQEKGRDSDVIVEDAVVPTVDVVDSDDEQVSNTRTTRTKSKRTKKQPKRTRNDSSNSDSGQQTEKRPRSDSDLKDQDKETMNATYVSESTDLPALNATVVVENPTYVKSAGLADDEKEIPKTTIKASKQVFSAFEQSPVKKKVEAFEKLRQEASALPVLVTRTKTRAMVKDKNKESNVKEKAKFFTPAASRFYPEATRQNEVLLSAKSASALKASQAESRERVKQRKEKELDVQKKREALLQAQIEEKKRKREERQLKAQQQRELLEREKQKALEAQRLKEEERRKQLLAEQEERKLKMRAIEEKKEKERAEIIAKMKKKPMYMVTQAPLLPTEDCYDSDDEHYRRSITNDKPEWTRNVKRTELIVLAAGDAVKNSFFWRQATTPDLTDIFENIDARKLKRSSSAIWHKPPRYTMMPCGLERHDETDEVFTDSSDE